MRVVSLCLFACLSVFSGHVFAVPVLFDFSSSATTNSYYDRLTYNQAGLNLEVFSNLEGAQVSHKSGGLGVRALVDSSDMLDGSSSFDSLIFAFSRLVTLLDLQFSYIDSGDEFSLQASTFSGSYSIPADGLVAGLSIDAAAFSFGVTDANDDYRIESMVVDYDADAPVPTPEPSTWLLLGSGLFGLFCWRKRCSG